MEGILEKPSKIPGRKTKVWSVLDDTTLSFFKENKRSSCIDSIDLSDILSVTLGTKCQFEIKTDLGSNTYTAESAEKCTEWVKQLSKYSKEQTDTKPSQPRRNSVMHAKKECGEHTVEVKAARTIFEEKSKFQNKTTYSCPSPIKESPNPFRKSDLNKAFKTIDDARSNLNHVSVKTKPVEPKIAQTLKQCESYPESVKNSSHNEETKQTDKMNSDIDSNEKSKNNIQEDGNTVTKHNQRIACEPELGNDLNSITASNMGNTESRRGTSSIKKSNLVDKGKDEKPKPPDVVKSEKIGLQENGGLSDNKRDGNSKNNESAEVGSKSDAKNYVRDTKHKSLKKEHAIDDIGNNNTSCVDSTEKAEVAQVANKDSSENRPDSGYSTAVGENGRNSQENKADVADDKEAVEKCKLSKGMKAQTIDLGKGIAKSKDESSKTLESEHNEEEADAIVVMRKSRSFVSVSSDDKISVVENPESDSSESTFPNLRRSNRSALGSGVKNNNSKPDLLGACKSLDKETSERDMTESDVLDPNDETDGTVVATPEKEIVENYIDIDEIVRKIDFPNIPSLPNVLPKEKDLKFLSDLKGALDSSDSSGDMSDSGSLSGDDLMRVLVGIIET